MCVRLGAPLSWNTSWSGYEVNSSKRSGRQSWPAQARRSMARHGAPHWGASRSIWLTDTWIWMRERQLRLSRILTDTDHTTSRGLVTPSVERYCWPALNGKSLCDSLTLSVWVRLESASVTKNDTDSILMESISALSKYMTNWQRTEERFVLVCCALPNIQSISVHLLISKPYKKLSLKINKKSDVVHSPSFQNFVRANNWIYELL